MSEVLEQEAVTISASAERRIGEILSAEPAGTMLRIAVSGGGCSGFSYGFTLDDSKGEDDHLIERGRAKVLIDEMSLEYMKGSEIDFANDLIGQSFKIHNPLAKSSCGCGTSFSL